MFIVIRASDDGTGPWQGVREGKTTAEELALELRYARSFVQRSANEVEFTVADRNNDASEETICYCWSGTPGDPLTRQYNGGTVVEILPNVHDFDLDYVIQTIVDPSTRYFVRSVNITVQVGPDVATQVNTAADVLNAPEVPSP